MRRYKIYGPPGTGKTTYLLGLMDQALRQVKPSECAFVSFTRKGTYEGVHRAVAKFKLKERDIPYFKTIHALCFSAVGAKRHNMLQRTHYKKFSAAMGLPFLGYYTEELKSDNDQYLFAEQLERNNEAAFMSLLPALSLSKYSWIRTNYRRFKSQLRVIDFTDLLELYLKLGAPLPVKAAFIDEAQDLTDLQWRVVDKMFQQADHLYVAGDDDQAIYEWSGAAVRNFLNFEAEDTVLGKSYRLPVIIHDYAMRVADAIKNRQHKKFISNDAPGVLSITTSWNDIELLRGESTLILSRNNCFLNDAAYELQQRGVTYRKKGAPSIDPKLVAAARKYEDYRKHRLGVADLALYAHFYKEIDRGKHWYDVLNTDVETKNYYRQLAANKTPLDKCYIDIETIHSAKGGEADHVILLMDVTPQVYNNFKMSPDSEMRCLYVGVTRARKKLTILVSKSPTQYPVLNGGINGTGAEMACC